MLYLKPRAMHQPAPPMPLHYFDSAELLCRLQAEGHTRVDMARMSGLTIPQMTERMRLMELDEGLRTFLRREQVPERIALMLLALRDPVSRRRLARRIVGERLCIRDAALLVASACRQLPPREAPRPQVIALIRDTRMYRNAVCNIAKQMKTAGVEATFSERRTGGMQEMTIAYPARRRRTERYHAM